MTQFQKFSAVGFFLLIIVTVLALFTNDLNTAGLSDPAIAGADVAWVLVSTAFVLLMTPGLAFFYGGMVSKKNVISTMLQSFISMAVITILWVVVGFSLAFGEDVGGYGIIGDPRTFFMMDGVLAGKPWSLAPTIPLVLFAMFQMKFAIITPALITGAFAERIRFSSYLLFIVLFIVFIYAPICHATWHPEGILFKYGVLDFAGGTVVHMSAGWAALVAAIYLKSRHEENKVHNPARITYVLLGTGLLWFGWFGFNAGSALGANGLAALALSTTTVAAAAAAITWILFDSVTGNKPSATGTAIGAVVGLVAITPAAGFISIPHAIVIGVVASIVSNLLIRVRTKTKVDDTLDVFACHGAGGMVGMLLTGVFANKAFNSMVAENGLFYGETALFMKHAITLVGVSVFFVVATYIILKITDIISPLRVSEEDEMVGLDMSQHAEKL
jgi:ammonium transporter, Amt family